MARKKRRNLLQNVRADSKEQIINYSLRQARVEANLMGKDLGRALGISECTYHFYESLRINTPEDIKIKISKILGKPVESLFPENLEEIVRDLNLRRAHTGEERLKMLNKKINLGLGSNPTRSCAGGGIQSSIEYDAKLLSSLINPLDIEEVKDEELPEYYHSLTLDSAQSNELREKLNVILNTLTFREREIIKLRYGLGEDNKIYTLREIGKKFNICFERVRSIETQTIRKLQRPYLSKHLESFLVA